MPVGRREVLRQHRHLRRILRRSDAVTDSPDRGGEGAPAPSPLLAVPNFSEGRDGAVLDAIARAALDGGADRLLDLHADADHGRAVLTLAGAPGRLAFGLAAAAVEAARHIDLSAHGGVHPHVGALDVAPVVYLDDARHGPACAEALVAADEIARVLDAPVFLYGELAGGRTRAELRRGGPAALARRIEQGELRPDFGPARAHPRAGAVLVAVRPPLVAFNVDLAAPADHATARTIAAAIREGGPEGLAGVRALGLWLAEAGHAQVSCNVEDPARTPLAAVVEAVRRHARVARAELVGLAPAAAFAGFPDDVPVFPARRTIEDALA